MARSLEALILPAYDDLPGLPSEVDPWVDRLEPVDTVEIPGLGQPVRCSGGIGVIPTGVGKVAAATTVTRLVTSDALDLADTYFLSAGIAGGPPERVSIGSVVVADRLVDWDNKLRFDAPRDDAPRAIAPNPYNTDRAVVHLDDELVELAAEAIDRTDLEVVVGTTATEVGTEADAPVIHVGTNLCGDELFHGVELATSADWLVDALEQPPYLATEMEDIATAVALARHGSLDRYLSIRGIANFDRPGDDGIPFGGDATLADGASIALSSVVSAITDVLDALPD